MEGKMTFVALDVNTLDDVGGLVEELGSEVGGFKVGMQLATRVGAPQACQYISDRGGRVFLDLKFKDISNTVKAAAEAAAALGVAMFNIHADGGSPMIRAAVQGRDQAMRQSSYRVRPLVISVTVLTSMDSPALKEIGYRDGMPVEEQVVRLALLAANNGCDGVVASAQEARAIRRVICDESFAIITPAIRMEWATWVPVGDDQARPTTHVEAVEAGATHVVAGRPLLKAPNRREAAIRMEREMAGVRRPA